MGYMQQLLAESDEAWALYGEGHYHWCNAGYHRLWGAEPGDPWTLFSIPPGPYHGTHQHQDEEITVRVIPDKPYYLIHCKPRNDGIYREAFRRLPVGLVLTCVETATFLDVNQAAHEISGFVPGGSTLSMWRDQSLRDYYIKYLKQHDKIVQTPFPILDTEGRPVDSITSAARFQWGDLHYLIGTLGPPPPDADLLHTKSELLQQIFEYAPALIVLSDDSGRMQKVNRAVCALTGYSASELQSRPFYELIPEDERQKVHQVVEQCLTQEDVTYSENHWVTSTGEKRLLQWSNTRLNNAFNDEIVHVGIARDVTEQRKAESRFRSLVDNAPDAILEIASNGTVLFANPTARQIFGAILKTPILNWVHEEDWQRVADEMQKPQTDVHCRMLHCEHGWRWFACKGRAGIFIIRDITAVRQRNEHLQTQRINEVVSALAEEFQRLHQNLQVTLEKADFNQAQDVLHQANELAEQLRKLNQEAQFQPERATLETMLKEIVAKLTASFSKVRIQLELQTQESWLSGGRAQLEQLLLNLGLTHPSLHISTVPSDGEWVELRIGGANLQASLALDQAVVIPGDPLRIFLPLTQ
ncbi:PAS domain S-box protein [bacterium]|nr:PAS domain S-box protein [bacterium]